MYRKSKLTILEANVLLRCSEVEESVADMYRYLAEIHGDNTRVAMLFQNTAREEDEHANQFKLASRLQGEGMQAVKVGFETINTIHGKIKDVFQLIRKNPPEIKKSLEVAMKIESRLGEYHMNSIVVFQDENLAKLFTAMRHNDADHYHKFKEAYDSF